MYNENINLLVECENVTPIQKFTLLQIVPNYRYLKKLAWWTQKSVPTRTGPGVPKLDLAVAQVTVTVAPCVVRRTAPFITKNEK